ncbi:PH domain-containing protein [Pseudidiomarina marina]|nr:PH domain-containing protein [Pseudidiomarina marina]
MTELVWQRTPILTIGFFIAKEVRNLVRNITNFIPVLAAIFVSNSDWLPYAVIGGYLVFIVVSAFLNHHFFLYALADDAVHLRTGVFGKKSLTLKYERIQQAELDQSWYFRPFDLVILRVDSAGSAGKEVEIPGLPFNLAQDLRQRMLAQTASAKATTENTVADREQTEAPAETELTFSMSEIVRAGIMDNKIFVLLAVLIYPLSQTDMLEERLVPWLEANVSFLEESLWLNIGLAVAALAVLFILAVGVTLIRYYNLHFSILNERYQARSGLFTIRTVSFRYQKLQRVQLRQNFRGRLLKRFSIRVSQLQPSAHAQQQSGSASFVLPVLTQHLVTELCGWLKLPRSGDLDWQGISFIALLNPSFWIALIAPTVLLVTYANDVPLMNGFFTAALLWLAIQGYAIARWRNYGFTISNGWLAIKRGVFGRKENWYPLHKAQQIDVYQSPWLRLLGYADVFVHTAAGPEVIKYQPVSSALAMQREWASMIGSNHQRWM